MVRSTMLVAGCLTVMMALAHASQGYQDDGVDGLIKQFLSVIESLKGKRGCSGYMCGHSHMSSAAATKVIKDYMYKQLWKCVQDSRACTLKKRKRRDVSHDEQLESTRKEMLSAAALHHIQTRSTESRTRPSLRNLLLKSHRPS